MSTLPSKRARTIPLDFQTDTTKLVDSSTQAEFSRYPRLWDDEDRMARELLKIQAALTTFISRLSTVRTHYSAMLEITHVYEDLKRFLTFHRHEIQAYMAAIVPEGHRTIVRTELRSRSNDCIMPIFEVIDKIKVDNLNLIATKGPICGYRLHVEELEAERGRLELVRFIEPPKLLI